MCFGREIFHGHGQQRADYQEGHCDCRLTWQPSAQIDWVSTPPGFPATLPVLDVCPGGTISPWQAGTSGNSTHREHT